MADHQNTNSGRFCKGEDHPRWKGGKKIASGYLYVQCPGHPRADRDGYVGEHILRAEKALGKPLPHKAHVHHANGSRDNGPLVICEDNAYHMLLERRTKAYKACGHASWRKCTFCQKYDDPNNMRPGGNGSFRHTKCNTEYYRKRRAMTVRLFESGVKGFVKD